MSYNIEQRDSDIWGSTSAIQHDLDFSRAPQHIVGVTMTVRGINADTTVLVMPAWSPGSYRIRDYIAHQGNVVAYAGTGASRKPISYSWRDKSSLVIVTKGHTEIQLEYLVYGLERSVRTNHINRNHAFVLPTATLMYVEGRTQEPHHVLLKHDQHQWPTVSTPLSPVRTANADGVLLGAVNYDVLADSPMEIGDHKVVEFTSHGAKHEVAVSTSQPIDVSWLASQAERIVNVEAQIFGGLPYDRYVFIVQIYPNGGGGLEHARGSVNAIDPSTLLDKSKSARLLSLLCHEFFHVWNVKRIRPIELGPFDYQQEVYTPMLWLAEGLTAYYDDLLHYRCGFATEKEYVETLAKDHVLKLLRVPGRHAMSVRDSSLLTWVKQYQASADGTNRFPSYYLKGGVIMLLLDLHIISHTDGERSLDHALRALWDRYLKDPGTGLTEDETIAIMERSTNVQLREMLMGWLDGTGDLPIDSSLANVGYELTHKVKHAEEISFGEKREFATVPPEVFVGWAVAEHNGSIFVRSVEDGGPAQQAGVGIDDEIISVGGQRVLSVAHLTQLLAATGSTVVEVLGQCDGRMYTTSIKTIPDPFVTIEPAANPTTQQLKNRETWLKRHV